MAQYLVTTGIEANKIQAIGYGFTKPISSKVLGSISRCYYDGKTNVIYVAVRYLGGSHV